MLLKFTPSFAMARGIGASGPSRQEKPNLDCTVDVRNCPSGNIAVLRRNQLFKRVTMQNCHAVLQHMMWYTTEIYQID